MGDLALYSGPTTTAAAIAGGINGVAYKGWEAANQFGCLCDDGYSGGDCSSRKWPPNV